MPDIRAPAARGASVRLEAVTKRFGDVVALAGIDLEIGRGEFFAILGPSGSGKTTALKLIGGFDRPTSGVVHLGDEDVTLLPAFRRDVNTVFQSYALFPHLTVRRNVEYGLRMKGVGRRERARAALDALEQVRLRALADRNIAELSGGEQQRVALARALVNRPQVLLLDEPLGALDLKLRRTMQLELKRLHAEVGVTFLYVTHDQEEALTMADRMAVMDHGRVLQVGTPIELYERPASRFVAEFIGASSFLRGRVTSQGGATAVVRLDDGSQIVAATARVAAVAGEVTLAIRPEACRIRPRDATPEPGCNAIRARIEASVYAGSDTWIRLRTTAGDELTVRSANAQREREGGLSEGDDVVVEFPIEGTLVIAEAPVTDDAAGRGSAAIGAGVEAGEVVAVSPDPGPPRHEDIVGNEVPTRHLGSHR